MLLRHTKLFTALKRLTGDASGNVAIIFAIALLPILLATGAAIDYGRGNALKVRIQAALDATGLMLAQQVGTMPADELIDQADEIFAVNFLPQDGVEIAPLEVSVINDTIRLSATAQMDTTIMGLGGIEVMNVAADTEVVRAEDSFEVVLVLDNTGSMRGSKIRALQDASELLINNLFGEADVHPLLDMGLVPFSHAVNVGTENRHASWLDRNARNPLHAELFDEDFVDQGLTRFDLYDRIRNVSWPGCVEARKYPLDVNDTPGGDANPDTLFVPYFYPDEPGDAGRHDGGYFNSYLDDRGRRRDTDEENQMRTAKYRNGVRARQDGNSSYGLGPAYYCTANPILPLTNRKRDVLDAIDDMEAEGYTNITEGLMWGLRAISPGEPFVEGKPYGTDDHHKIIILLTDGKNEVPSTDWSNHNKSMYGPYGYMASGRLVNSRNKNTITDKMNERTAEACHAVKAQDIELFTITFQVSDSDTASLMRNCATQPDMYYNSPDTSTLKAVFKAIATRISELRISM